VNLLLDTHMYLWWLTDDARLSDPAVRAIADPAAVVHVSAASIWECSVKTALGRLEVDGLDLVEEITANGFSHLPITATHAWEAGSLPPHHRDPFDRVLIAQARCEQLLLVTSDEAVGAYDVAVLR
jgi:PIN domain nuclease of toxin-antitoxin system